MAGTEWTDEQTRLLIECAVHATVVTGHELGDIATHLGMLCREYRQGKVDEDGRRKDV